MLLNNAALLDAIETALIEANDAFKGWPELASAALRAIADAGPSEKMVEAGARAWLLEGDADPDVFIGINGMAAFEIVKRQCRAAIAAALKEMGA